MPSQSEAILCRCSLAAIEETMWVWFNKLLTLYIKSCTDLNINFLMHFIGTKRPTKSSLALVNIIYRGRDSLRSFIQRFNKVCLSITHINHSVALAVFKNRMTDLDFRLYLH